MAVSRTHRYTVDPADLEELIARRATVIAAIRVRSQKPSARRTCAGRRLIERPDQS